MSAQFHLDPATYLETIRAEVPRFDELQRRTISAVPFAPDRVLELGFGTGETTRRLLATYPRAAVTGLDSSPEMIFHAREMPVDARLARMEDPLPDGPWDLVIAVLSVQHLDSSQKRELFRRVREQSRALVIGDIVAVGPERRAAQSDSAAELAEWCAGAVVWEADEVAVITATYD